MTKVLVKDAAGRVTETRIDDLQQNSIKISINAKGGVASDMKIYEDDPEKMKEKLVKYHNIVKSYRDVCMEE